MTAVPPSRVEINGELHAPLTAGGSPLKTNSASPVIIEKRGVKAKLQTLGLGSL
jgi:hypothetical protein